MAAEVKAGEEAVTAAMREAGTAELLPEIEAVMVRKLNERMAEHDKPGLSA